MTIGPVGAAAIAPVAPPLAPGAAGTAAPAGGTSFARGLAEVERLQQAADDSALGLATGELANVHDFTTAAAKAQLGVELTAALRNRAVEAYQEIMRMQV